MDQGNAEYGCVGGEALIVFDKVFVPNEHVFMCGEYEFAGELVERFATFHRQNYGGCKGGLADVLVGAVYALTQAQGTSKASHVKDKLAEMIHLAETIYCCSIACSCQGFQQPAGCYQADPLLANITKLNVTRNVYEVARLAHDITGGLLATMPSEFDLHDPATGKWVDKYMKGVADVPAETTHPSHPAYRRHDLRHRAGRIHARRRFTPGAEDHDRKAGQPRAQEETGGEAGQDRRAAFLRLLTNPRKAGALLISRLNSADPVIRR